MKLLNKRTSGYMTAPNGVFYCKIITLLAPLWTIIFLLCFLDMVTVFIRVHRPIGEIMELWSQLYIYKTYSPGPQEKICKMENSCTVINFYLKIWNSNMIRNEFYYLNHICVSLKTYPYSSRSYIFVCMSSIVVQTAGPNGLTFLEGTVKYSRGNKG